MIEFQAWPKIPRLYRPAVITEKIDGTNGAIIIEPGATVTTAAAFDIYPLRSGEVWDGLRIWRVGVQSRKRLITPEQDNYGFARWVHDHATELVIVLGEGRHYGEWWGGGIQRGYGLPKGDHRFSLFNTERWTENGVSKIPGLHVVPTLWRGKFSTEAVDLVMSCLRWNGSSAVPGYMRPEGVVVYHQAGDVMFKATLENDDEPKAAVRRRELATAA